MCERHAPASTMAIESACVGAQRNFLELDVVHGAVPVHVDSDAADTGVVHLAELICCDGFRVNYGDGLGVASAEVRGECC